jgi:acetylglutamate kinase
VNDLVVVKLGGLAVNQIGQALAEGARVVLVHGGGAQITDLMRGRGIEPRFVGGRRFTDLAVLACARHALASVSDALSAEIEPLGRKVVQLYRGEVTVARQERSLGLVGVEPVIDGEAVMAIVAAGAVPLVAPLGRDSSGRFLNINADDVAAAVAVAVRASLLRFLSSVEGVLDGNGRVIERLRLDDLPPIGGGMVPKLEACRAALAGGVDRVIIGTGTEVTL